MLLATQRLRRYRKYDWWVKSSQLQSVCGIVRIVQTKSIQINHLADDQDTETGTQLLKVAHRMHWPIKLTGGKFEAARRWWVSIVQGMSTPVFCLLNARLQITYKYICSQRTGKSQEWFPNVCVLFGMLYNMVRKIWEGCLLAILYCSDLIYTSWASKDKSIRSVYPDPEDIIDRENWSCNGDSLDRLSVWILALVTSARNKYLQRRTEIGTKNIAFSLTGNSVVLPTNSQFGRADFVSAPDLNTWQQQVRVFWEDVNGLIWPNQIFQGSDSLLLKWTPP